MNGLAKIFVTTIILTGVSITSHAVTVAVDATVTFVDDADNELLAIFGLDFGLGDSLSAVVDFTGSNPMPQLFTPNDPWSRYLSLSPISLTITAPTSSLLVQSTVQSIGNNVFNYGDTWSVGGLVGDSVGLPPFYAVGLGLFNTDGTLLGDEDFFIADPANTNWDTQILEFARVDLNGNFQVLARAMVPGSLSTVSLTAVSVPGAQASAVPLPAAAMLFFSSLFVLRASRFLRKAYHGELRLIRFTRKV